jgi:hypothetical protein
MSIIERLNSLASKKPEYIPMETPLLEEIFGDDFLERTIKDHPASRMLNLFFEESDTIYYCRIEKQGHIKDMFFLYSFGNEYSEYQLCKEINDYNLKILMDRKREHEQELKAIHSVLNHKKYRLSTLFDK